jgi:hypothetical protein
LFATNRIVREHKRGCSEINSGRLLCNFNFFFSFGKFFSETSEVHILLPVSFSVHLSSSVLILPFSWVLSPFRKIQGPERLATFFIFLG